MKLTDDVIYELADKYLSYESGYYGGIEGQIEFARAIEAYLNGELAKFEYKPYQVEVSKTMWDFIQSQKKRVE